jgi:hypothetical protein
MSTARLSQLVDDPSEVPLTWFVVIVKRDPRGATPPRRRNAPGNFRSLQIEQNRWGNAEFGTQLADHPYVSFMFFMRTMGSINPEDVHRSGDKFSCDLHPPAGRAKRDNNLCAAHLVCQFLLG